MAACSLALVAGGAAATFSEARPYLYASGEADKLAAFAEGGIAPGLSVLSARVLLDDCHGAMTSLRALTEPPAVRANVARGCAGLAHVVTAQMPTYSHGWYVAARSALVQADPSAMNAALVLSARTGPAELWLAALRVGLGEQALETLSAQALAGHERDLALLASARRGVEALAPRYLADADFRERLVRLLEAEPPARQRTFVNEIRRALALLEERRGGAR